MQHGVAAELLARSRMFHGIHAALLESIVDRSELRQFGPGQALTHVGSPADAAHLIIEGDVSLHGADGELLDTTLGRGAILDEMAMFVATEHFPGAAAATPVWALVIPREVIGRLIVDYPELAQHFIHNTRQNLVRIADTLRSLDNMLLESEKALDAIPVAGALEETEPESPAAGQSAQAAPRHALGPLGVNAQNGLEDGHASGTLRHGIEGNGANRSEVDISEQTASDLMTQLDAAISREAQSSPGPERGPTASPNRAPRRRPAWPLPRSEARD